MDKDSNIFLTEHNNFQLEFFAYNFTSSYISKKIYVRPFLTNETNVNKFLLDNEKVSLISSAINNKYLSSFSSERYSLYDISFRDSDSIKSIGFCFNDIKDITYIEPKQIFEHFNNYNILHITDIINKTQKAIFPQCPKYNPVYMIGLVIEESELTCLKSYIRFDLEEANTTEKRERFIEHIVKTFGSNSFKDSSAENFKQLTQKLENLGFIFSFVGIDFYSNGTERFKLYYRLYEIVDSDLIVKEISTILSQLGLYNNIKEIINQHYTGIWGIALSTKVFQDINGLQLYLYP